MGDSIGQISNLSVRAVIKKYPDKAIPSILYLRRLIFGSAKEFEVDLEETLKWGEPSYLSKQGSTVRIAWHKGHSDQVGIYFNCKTTLLDTFREIYPQKFHFEGVRAILFNLGDTRKIELSDDDVAAISYCIGLSLTYHKRKHLPFLGAIPR